MAAPSRFAWIAALLVTLAAWHVPCAAGAALPDGRGYELVSAVDKNGGDVMADPARVRVADDGSAAGYASLSVFGDALGGGVATEYLSVRSGAPAPGGQGWTTHAVSPPQATLSYAAVLAGLEPRYEQDLSPDLSRGVVLAWRPLTFNPYVGRVANLYLRTDLRSPGPGSYALITDCPLCIGPLGADRLAAAPQLMASTPDFGRVLFESPLNLAPGAAGGALKLYEWDAATQAVALAGVLPDGGAALDSAAGTGHGRHAHRHAISSDGRKVFFMADEPAGVTNVYMRLDGASTVKLNRSEATVPGTAASARYWDASESGSRVFFTSPERLTDDAPGSGAKLYMYDTTKPDDDPHNLTFLSADHEPSDPASNLVEGVVGASADGSTVYFWDTSQLVAGLPPLTTHAAMYAWHDGQTSFVAALPSQDASKLADGTGKTARVSRSGDLVYLSTEPVGPDGYDHGSCPNTVTRACAQLYVYRIATHALSCASCNPSGAPGGANAETLVVRNVGGSSVTGHLGRVITDDGRRVFFTTAAALVPGDVNGKKDAYEYDVERGTVSLLSSGRSPADSYFMEATPSGDDAFFLTRERLVGWDRDASYDLYDARVGGGFPEPAASSPPCSGDACRAPFASAPALVPAASALTRSAGNLGGRHRARARARRRCRRGTVRKKARGRRRCVRRTRHARRARRRAARARRAR